VAEAFGAKGIRLEEPGDVRDALAEALAYKDGPVVVDAVVDPFALSLPSHVPFHTAKGYTLSMAKQVLSGRMDTVIKTVERNCPSGLMRDVARFGSHLIATLISSLRENHH
jgi:pyruvate dehydrogenase (quinone)